MKRKFIVFSILFIGVYLIQSCNRDYEKLTPELPKAKLTKEFSSENIYEWSKFYLRLTITNPGYRPPISARALAYIGLSGYEAAAGGMEKFQSLSSRFPEINLPKTETNKIYNWAISANRAYYRSIKNFVPEMFPDEIKTADSLLKVFENKFSVGVDTATVNRSIRYGEAIAKAVYEYSRSDGGEFGYRNNKPLDYRPPIGVDKWRPTPPDFLRALTPYWGNIRAFTFKKGEIEYKEPLKFSTEFSSPFNAQVMEVYNITTNITNEQKWIAEFWCDDFNQYTIDVTGRWIAIADQYLIQEKADLETVLATHAKLGMALHDAAVACWDEKYKFNVLRPVSYIQAYRDKNWLPPFVDPSKAELGLGVTPQHPSYPSGHSVFGQVSAEILINLFGDNINLTDRTHENEKAFDGRPRTFKSFSEMAKENAYSRIYGGVHYRMDCEEGLRLGKVIGERINVLSWKR